MAVRCVSAYRNGMGQFTVGQEVGGQPLEDWLLRDSPGSWERVEEIAVEAKVEAEPDKTTPEVENTALDEVPVHRAILGRKPPGRR